MKTVTVRYQTAKLRPLTNRTTRMSAAGIAPYRRAHARVAVMKSWGIVSVVPDTVNRQALLP
jgi:hypothetical protein